MTGIVSRIEQAFMRMEAIEDYGAIVSYRPLSVRHDWAQILEFIGWIVNALRYRRTVKK